MILFKAKIKNLIINNLQIKSFSFFENEKGISFLTTSLLINLQTMSGITIFKQFTT